MQESVGAAKGFSEAEFEVTEPVGVARERPSQAGARAREPERAAAEREEAECAVGSQAQRVQGSHKSRRSK